MQELSAIPIVLTATITPNGITESLGDPKSRRAEYLEAIQFYSSFSQRVFFLENSLYPIRQEIGFTEHRNLELRELSRSTHPERGKGYQEFEMLDAWVATESTLPAGWLKISGRYLIRNIADILKDCSRETRASMIIDQSKRSATARTQVFYVTTTAYRNAIEGLHRQCDDRTGKWIERVLFERLKERVDVDSRFFKHRPQIEGRESTTGVSYPSNALSGTIKQIIRTGNGLFDRRYLWFSR